MCGDLEEEDSEAERLYGSFLQAAHGAIHDAVDHRGGARSRLKEAAADDNQVDESHLHGYMDGLFADVLSACIKDGKAVSGPLSYRVLRSQVAVLARVTGFLAARLDLREDPLRSTIEALMAGYGDTAASHTEH